MYVVAIVDLGTSVEAEAAALAADLGSTAYEQRLQLVAGLPAVVQKTPDRAKALALLRKLRGRGHGAVAFDSAAVVSSAEMVLLRRGRVEPDGLGAEDPSALGVPGAPVEVVARLPFDDILALIRATHRRAVETKVEVKERKLGVGRALLSGGLLLTKSVTREETRSTDERDQVLYIFRKSGELPWLLRERQANYGWLGGQLAPSSLQNLVATVALLRARAPGALYDDRLMGFRKPLQIAIGGQSGGGTSSEPTVDLLAHVLAMGTARAEPDGLPALRERSG